METPEEMRTMIPHLSSELQLTATEASQSDAKAKRPRTESLRGL